MDENGDHSKPHSKPHGFRLVLWLGIIFIIAALVWSKTRIAHQNAEEIRIQNRSDRARRDKLLPLAAAFNKLIIDGAVEGDFKKQFARFKPHAVVRSLDPHYQGYDFSDPGSRFEFIVNFHDGRICQWQCIDDATPFPRNLHAWEMFSAIAGPASTVAVMAWIVLLILAMNCRRRKLVGEIMVALAIVCSIIWAADHSQAIVLQFEPGRWPLWVGGGMLMYSILIAIWRARPQFVGTRCEECDYDLTGNTSGTCPECGALAPESIAIFDQLAKDLSNVK